MDLTATGAVRAHVERGLRKMCRRFLFVYFACVFLAVGLTRAEVDPPARTNSSDQLKSTFDGQWVYSKEANRLLGYGEEFERKGAEGSSVRTPKSLRLKHLAANATEVDAKVASIIGPDFFGDAAVSLVRWESDFHREEFIEPTSFLVRKSGSTKIYSGVPFAILYGGEIELVQGRDKSKDLLVINFLSYDHQKRGTAVYRRRAADLDSKTQPREKVKNDHFQSAPSD